MCDYGGLAAGRLEDRMAFLPMAILPDGTVIEVPHEYAIHYVGRDH